MSSVYVVQRPRFKNPLTGEWQDKYDLKPAEQFGEIKEILRPGNFTGAERKNVMLRIIENLKDFNSDDYLLALGDPVMIAAAACVAMDYAQDFIRVLKWDRQIEQYMPFVISLDYESNMSVLEEK